MGPSDARGPGQWQEPVAALARTRAKGDTMGDVGIDVALRRHRVAVLDEEGERVGCAFTVEATAAGYTALQGRLQALGSPPSRRSSLRVFVGV